MSNVIPFADNGTIFTPLKCDVNSNLNVNVAAGTLSISSVNIKDSSGNNLNSTSNALNSYITNFPTKTDSHIYASKNGNPNSVEILKSDNHQHLLTRLTNDGETAFNTFDADGGINSHITGGSVSISNTVPISAFDGSTNVALRAEGTSNNLRVAPYINNTAVGATTATNVLGSKYGMNNFVINSVSEPVPIGGMDNTGNLRNIKTDASANLLVNVSNFPASQVVSGSVSVSGGSVSVGAISNGTTTIQAGIASKVFQDCMTNIKGVNPTGGANNEMVSTGRPDLNKTGNTANSFSIALDTNSFLNGYNPSTGNIKMLTMDESVGSKRALDVNVVNSSSSAVQITNGTINASINPTISNLASANGLVVDSVNYGLNISAGTISPITTIINGSKNQMETRDNDAVAELTTIDNKIVQGYNTTNDSGVIGLNTYSIYPKYKYYSMRGRSTVADSNMIFGGVGNSRYFYSDAFGIANVKTWWAYSESVARTITYEYVDASGNQAVGTTALPATTWTQLTLQNGSVGSFLINKFSQNINTSPATNQLYISHTTPSQNYCAFGGYYQDNYNSIFTVPNGFLACITNVMFYSNAADDYFLMLRWSASGIRDVVYYWTSRSGAQQNVRENYAGQFGGVGVVFTAGETIAFATLNAASYKDFSATVQLMPV